MHLWSQVLPSRVLALSVRDQSFDLSSDRCVNFLHFQETLAIFVVDVIKCCSHRIVAKNRECLKNSQTMSGDIITWRCNYTFSGYQKVLAPSAPTALVATNT